MDEIKTKQQVVERIKKAEKILITVSNDPSVDELSAALGLTLVLDSQDKYVSAIYSGETPPAIAFLQPEKTFDDTTDSLRDFVIALNKEKADHLRYKVEGDSVKIFITPYKTTISSDDLDFSQGDYNIELVIALGVDNQDHLDGALAAHGQILHDADIITVTAGDQTSNLGGIDWHEAQASSLCEMVAGLVEALKDDKKKPLLTESSATALLTGIVAKTDRFSNEHTTSKVMSVAAALMTAGADQQLIATELQDAHQIYSSNNSSDSSDSEDSLGSGGSENSGSSSNQDEASGNAANKEDSNAQPGESNSSNLVIKHEETLEELDRRVRAPKKPQEKAAPAAPVVSVEAAQPLVPQAAEPVIAPSVAPIAEPIKPAEAIQQAYAPLEQIDDEPTLGGTLNATAEQAADDARRQEDEDRNKTILSHAYLGEAPQAEAQVSAQSEAQALMQPETQPAPAPQEAASIQVGGERVIQPLPHTETAPNPITDSPAPLGIEPQPAAPVDLGLPLPPPLPDFSALAGVGSAPALPLPPSTPPEILGDILAPEPAMPVASAMPTAPAVPVVPPAINSVYSATPEDPAQFKIPGQQ